MAFLKPGAYRAQFLLESLADLRQSLRQLGSDLVIRKGHPEEVIPALTQELEVSVVYWHEEVTAEEVAVEELLADRLKQLNIQRQKYWGATLYHPDNLPFDLNRVPEVFTQFRKKVERECTVDVTFSTPEQLPSLPVGAVGALPTLEDLGLSAPDYDNRAVLKFEGGRNRRPKAPAALCLGCRLPEILQADPQRYGGGRLFFQAVGLVGDGVPVSPASV